MGLSRDVTHTWPDGWRRGDSVECEDCGRPWHPKWPGHQPPEKWCDGLQRSSLSPVSGSNSGRESQKDEGLRDFVRNKSCVVCGAPPPNDACHHKSWGSGHGDRNNLWPGCRVHHSEQHQIGIQTFQRKHDINLNIICHEITEEYDEKRQ